LDLNFALPLCIFGWSVKQTCHINHFPEIISTIKQLEKLKQDFSCDTLNFISLNKVTIFRQLVFKRLENTTKTFRKIHENQKRKKKQKKNAKNSKIQTFTFAF
jgi:hypothetical protein